jgi:hypothetical protein
MPPARTILAACAALSLVAAGCGDRGKDDPIEVVKRYIESYDRGDLIVCDELVTEGYLRFLGRAAGGQDGRQVCEQQVRAAEQFDITVDVIPSVERNGDVVDVEVRLFVDDQQVEHEIRLRKRDDELLVERSDAFLGEQG